MVRLLYVGSGNPWQGGAGFLVRQNLFLSALGQMAELHLALFDYKTGPVPEYVKSVTPLAKPIRPANSRLKNFLLDATDPLPRMLRGYDLSEPRRQIRSLNPLSFPAVFAFRIDFAYFAGVLDHPNLILDIDDPEHVRSLRRLQAIGQTGDKRTLRDLDKLREFERQSVAAARLAFVCQENDRTGWTTPPEVVPNCVEVIPRPARSVSKPIVLFVGNCAGSLASPNVDAVRFFLADIWPKILQAVPDAEFHLIGAASQTVRDLATGVPRVHLRGFVDNLSEAYAHAALCIAPIRFGTGTRIKILEAFAHACPVVSTLAGAEGIDAVPGRDIELVIDADEFSTQCVSLLRDTARAEAIGQAGYQLARQHYDAAVQRQKLVARLGQLLNGKAAE
jgi:glycosyltransferase involved in cell wall biosynthesis